jgi:hypothetical protein
VCYNIQRGHEEEVNRTYIYQAQEREILTDNKMKQLQTCINHIHPVEGLKRKSYMIGVFLKECLSVRVKMGQLQQATQTHTGQSLAFTMMFQI